MSQYREQSERRKNQQIGINENYLYIFYIYIYVSSVAYVFKHNVDTAQKYAYPPFAFRLYCIFERFTDLHFLNEYTHMRNCVCLDTRLHPGIIPVN